MSRKQLHNRNAPLVFGLLASLLLFFFMIPQKAIACGPDTDCVIGERIYRIRMPEGHDGSSSVGAVFFMHGYRGSAAGVMRNRSLGKAVSDLGLALVAPKSAFGDWAIPGSPSGHEPVELEYFEAVVADIRKRFNIDASRMMASGFSAGGMMTWNLACDRGGLFAAYAPIAGTFWQPVPQRCDSVTVSIIHTHGTSDRVVPLEGRPIQNTRQGNVYEVLSFYSALGGFGEPEQDQEADPDLACREQKNPAGQVLELCLHPGGHSMQTAFVKRAWEKFVKLGIIPQ